MTQTTHPDDVWRSGPPPIEDYHDDDRLEVKWPSGATGCLRAGTIRLCDTKNLQWRPIPWPPVKVDDYRAHRIAGEVLGRLIERYTGKPVSIALQTSDPETLLFRIAWYSGGDTCQSPYYITLDTLAANPSPRLIAEDIIKGWDLDINLRPLDDA